MSEIALSVYFFALAGAEHGRMSKSGVENAAVKVLNTIPQSIALSLHVPNISFTDSHSLITQALNMLYVLFWVEVHVFQYKLRNSIADTLSYSVFFCSQGKPTEKRNYTAEEVSKHNSAESVWLIIKNKV